MSTLKRELIKRYTWRTRLDLELALVTYIGWYNARRRHLSLKHTADGRTRRQAPHQVLQRYNQQAAAYAGLALRDLRAARRASSGYNRGRW